MHKRPLMIQMRRYDQSQVITGVAVSAALNYFNAGEMKKAW
jgi:hypothetical protein